MTLNSDELLARARKCLELEEKAIRATAECLDETFVTVIRAIHDTILAGQKLIFTGVGKNVSISEKLAGTFNSTGAPACFLDPNQAMHGDLGLCAKEDLVFIISYSGETEEIIKLLPLLKRLDVTTVAITAAPESVLARNTDLNLIYRIEKEACPLNLAPTASTTAALALGDALAMVYLEVRGFGREDFARLHPAGSLGKSLLLRANEIMRMDEQFATLPQTCTVREAIKAITDAACGTIALTDPATGKLTGVFSDGDFRRSSLKNPNVMEDPIALHMSSDPKTVSADELGVEVLNLFEQLKVNDLVVIDSEGKPVGIIDGQDLPKLRIV